jgi:hypothetical protein
MSNQEIMAFVLDCPNEAAEELEQLRALKAWLIQTLEPALNQLLMPMPAGLDLLGMAGEYAERAGYARGAISAALDELKK